MVHTRVRTTLAVVAAAVFASGAATAADPVAPAAPPEVVAPSGDAPAEEMPPGDPAAAVFVSRCAGCHTIGGGKLTGPDLAPSTQWPAATLRPAIKKMEPRVGPLSDADLDMLIAFMKDGAVRERITAERDRAMQAVAARLDPPSIEQGRRLFTGETALQHGGLACAACHTAGGFGGSLGPDLTLLAGKMDRIAMMSAFEKAAFVLMREAYAKTPVTRQEALHLAAYFESLQTAPPATPSFAAIVPLGGAGLAGALLLLFALLTRGRRAADVRSRLVRDAMRR